jgi:hypothetical protein
LDQEAVAMASKLKKRLAKSSFSRGEHADDILTSIESNIDRKPATFGKRTIPEKVIYGFNSTIFIFTKTTGPVFISS